MPRAKLWSFEIGEDCRIYVKHGSTLLKKYGGVLKIKLAQEEDKQKDHIKVPTDIESSYYSHFSITANGRLRLQALTSQDYCPLRHSVGIQTSSVISSEDAKHQLVL